MEPEPKIGGEPVGELIVTSIRVHPTVIAHVRELCAAAGVNMNQFLILAACAVETDATWNTLVEEQARRSTAIGTRLDAIRRDRDVTPVLPPEGGSRVHDLEELAAANLPSRKPRRGGTE